MMSPTGPPIQDRTSSFSTLSSQIKFWHEEALHRFVFHQVVKVTSHYSRPPPPTPSMHRLYLNYATLKFSFTAGSNITWKSRGQKSLRETNDNKVYSDSGLSVGILRCLFYCPSPLIRFFTNVSLCLLWVISSLFESVRLGKLIELLQCVDCD